jgi:integrase
LQHEEPGHSPDRWTEQSLGGGGPACRQSIRCLFHQVRYSRLVAIADSKHWGKKTYNNAISILRRAFEFGYRNHPEQLNPARSLRSARLKKADRPRIDPFCMQDAETLIATIHRDWGEAQGNYDEFRLFTGMRPSEEIALVLSDLDLANGIVSVNKARVAGLDRDQTKTGEDRRVTLCPRAWAVLQRQLALRTRLKAAGLIRHDHVFFRETGEAFWNLKIQAQRWRATLSSLKLRYRRPYVARHSSVSWNLMVGKNPLWVAKQHGHSLTTMLRVYAAWAQGMVESDIEAIRSSMNRQAPQRPAARCRTAAASRPRRCTTRGVVPDCPSRTQPPPARGNLAVGLPLEVGGKSASTGNQREMYEWKGRDSKTGILINQQVTDRKGSQSPTDPPASPDLPADLPVASMIRHRTNTF